MIIYHPIENHIPEAIWQLSQTEEVYTLDEVNGDLIRVLDCTGIEDVNKNLLPTL